MGKLTFTLEDSTDGVLTKAYPNFKDADIAQWISANQSAANVAVNGTATHAQVFEYIISETVKAWVATTQSYNSSAAAAAASAAAPSISIT